jgi:manganese/iron transport system permease protein
VSWLDTSWLVEPWQHSFMQHAFAAIILVGVISGVTGVFVTLRGLAFFGDALAHAVFPGIVIAHLIGGNVLVGALVAAVVVALGIGAIGQSGRVSNDTAIGILFAGGFALGVALLATERSYTRDLTAFLLGSILGVTRQDLLLTGGIGAFVLATMFWFRRELTMIAFDRVFAQAKGINVWLFDQLFLVLLALAIVVSLQTVGNVLVLAMLVTPAATARLLSDRLRVMVALAALIGAACGVAGLYLSYYRSVPSGASVVLVTVGVFGIVYLFAPRTGVISGRLARRVHYPHPERDAFTHQPEAEGAPRSPR